MHLQNYIEGFKSLNTEEDFVRKYNKKRLRISFRNVFISFILIGNDAKTIQYPDIAHYIFGIQ